MDIHFYITESAVENMSVDDYEALERAQDGEPRLYRLRPVVCRFMTDADNNPIPQDQALKLTGKMKLKEMMEFVQQFFATVEQKAVPKANGSLSKSPTAVEPTGSLSPDG